MAHRFEFLVQADRARRRELLAGESPADLALVLSYLLPEQAGAVLEDIPEELQGQVMGLMLAMTSRQETLACAAELRLVAKLGVGDTTVDGFAAGVRALARSAPVVEERVLEHLAIVSPDIGERVRRERLRFADIARMRDDIVRAALADVDDRTLALSLRLSEDATREAVQRNLAPDRWFEVRDHLMRDYAVRSRAITDAQSAVVERLFAHGGRSELGEPAGHADL